MIKNLLFVTKAIMMERYTVGSDEWARTPLDYLVF